MSHNIVFIFTLRYISRHFVVGVTFQASSIFIAVKTNLQKYHDTYFSRSGVNQMWILKNSKDLLET